MKSIRKYRLTRQALKEAPQAPLEPDAQNRDEPMEFPLGPRLFRKRSNRSAEEPERLTIHELSVEEKLTVLEKAPPAAPTADAEPLASETQAVKVIRDGELQSPGSGDGSLHPNRPDAATDPTTNRQSVEERQSPPLDAVAEPENEETEPRAQGDEDDASPKPVIVRPHEPAPAAPQVPAAAQPVPAAAQPVPAAEAQVRRQPKPNRDAAVKTRADRLNRYALKVGSLSYVLIDDDGHLVKKSGRPKQK